MTRWRAGRGRAGKDTVAAPTGFSLAILQKAPVKTSMVYKVAWSGRAYPFSSLWNVTRSIRPERGSPCWSNAGKRNFRIRNLPTWIVFRDFRLPSPEGYCLATGLMVSTPSLHLAGHASPFMLCHALTCMEAPKQFIGVAADIPCGHLVGDAPSLTFATVRPHRACRNIYR